jgi:hypothetical protein
VHRHVEARGDEADERLRAEAAVEAVPYSLLLLRLLLLQRLLLLRLLLRLAALFCVLLCGYALVLRAQIAPHSVEQLRGQLERGARRKVVRPPARAG